MDEYSTRANLGNGIDIPIASREDFHSAPGDIGLWETEPADEEVTTKLLTSLLSDQHKTLDSLERVLFLLESSEFHIVVTALTRPILKQIRTG